MSEIRTPLARLVLFMVCLSVAGSFLAGVHYFAVDLPQQQSLAAPKNDMCGFVDANYCAGTDTDYCWKCVKSAMSAVGCEATKDQYYTICK
jgi:hypothetical protein